MEWKKLLSQGLMGDPTKLEDEMLNNIPVNPFEQDYLKLVSWAAYRRLQDKTQVFPLAKSDFVRTRLTHSMEVSTIAKQLGIMCFQGPKKSRYSRLPLDADEKGEGAADLMAERAVSIPAILACAGLLHDLGNPPFGHAGEDIIGQWFKQNLDTLTDPCTGKRLRELFKDKPVLVSDLESFEGNAQALRILCKARYGSEINLHQATVSAMIKYPTFSNQTQKHGPAYRHKPGCYQAEQEAFKGLVDALGTENSDGAARHPLAYLVEAADDIAYRTADLEDAVKSGVVSMGELAGYLKPIADKLLLAYCNGVTDIEELKMLAEEPSELSKRREGWRIKDIPKDIPKDVNGQMPPAYFTHKLINKLSSLSDRSGDKTRAMSDWVVEARRWLMYVATFGFCSNYDRIMDGTYEHDLFKGTFHELTVVLLKQAMKEFVYSSRVIVEPEVSAQTILSFLLEKFVPAMIAHGTESEQTAQQKKLIGLISPNYLEDFRRATDAIWEEADAAQKKDEDGRRQVILNHAQDLVYQSILIATDFISGMTDGYARSLYRRMSGID